MARVVFVNVPAHPAAVLSVYPPIGVLSISSCLKMKGHEVVYIDADIERLDAATVVSRCRPAQPDLIGISLNVAQVAAGAPIIAALAKEIPDVPIVCGGPFVTGMGPEFLSLFPAVSYAILHEGEYAMSDLLEHLKGTRPLDGVRNLVYRVNDQPVSNPTERISDLEALPMPDYALIGPAIEWYTAPEPTIAIPSLHVMCTRGCPHDCTFCSSPSAWGRRVTFRSTESVIDEVSYLNKTFNVQEIFFQDDTLNARTAWFMELCDKIIDRGLHRTMAFKCSFRANERWVTPELLAKARQANFWMIFYGVENGNQAMLDRMHKKVSLDEIRRAFRLTREAGIKTYASLMIGNDGETEETVQDSLALLEEIQPDYGGFAIAAPFPGSRLYDTALRKGHIAKTDFTSYTHGECILRTEALDCAAITRLAEQANQRFNALKGAGTQRGRLETTGLAIALSFVDPLPAFHCGRFSKLKVSIANDSHDWLASFPPYPIFLSYHWHMPGGETIVQEGLRSPIKVPIQPHEVRSAVMDIKAPDSHGEFVLALTLVQEDCFWFEEHVKNLPVRIPVVIHPDPT